ncbi:AraC family transcriptional regulator [Calycomorphotria hydatis]|uniref:Virulence regulon transcriptional activator VirF n=1 Tax=Calycomorphotria hydatis TaxID=2528027 RepID=A0A517TDQ3_9PLAN|nr:helix-turn-helix domain-containing protein [Calycomorphotria hydatis]QDT66501.1 Virulence regulon transcriptional activator VirF [Calycomorphotria hydatis]
MPFFGMKTTKPKRNWKRERESFLRNISPDHHFFQVFDGLPNVYFFVKNERGETIFCSPNLPHNHGLQDESELIGKTDHDLTPGPLAEKYLADDAKIYRTGQPLPPQIEICMDHVGLPNWYRTCKYPIKDRRGKVIGIMGTFQLAEPQTSGEPMQLQLKPGIELIEDDLLTFPPISELAEACRLSVRQFQRLFKTTYGTSPRDYWMKLRIRAACELIRNSRLSIIEITNQLGFYDQSNFTRHFKKHTGKTPRKFISDNRLATTSEEKRL